MTVQPPYPGPGMPPGPVPPVGYRPPWVRLAPNGLPLADFGARLLAYLIDSLILSAVTTVLTVPAFLFFVLRSIRTSSELANDPNPDPSVLFADIFLPFILYFVAIILVMLLFTYLYHVEYQLRKGGQTFGKKAMKLSVAPVDPTASLTRNMLVARWGVQFAVGMVIPFFSYLNGFWQLWDKPFQQCLHDKAAKTVVVKVG